MKKQKLSQSRFSAEIPERKAVAHRDLSLRFYRDREIPDRKRDAAEAARCHVWVSAYEAVEVRQWTMMTARINHARSALSQCVDIDPEIMSGVPVVKNTRMPVSMVLSNVAADMSLDELAQDFELNKEYLVLIIRCLATAFDSPMHERHSARRVHDLQTIDEVVREGGEDSDDPISEADEWSAD